MTTPPPTPTPMPTGGLPCPVCLTRLPNGPSLARHVIACAAPSSSPPLTARDTALVLANCPMCHMVYAPTLAAHEIEFHEAECERVNERRDIPMDWPPLGSTADDDNDNNGHDDDESGEGKHRGPTTPARPVTGGKRPRDSASTKAPAAVVPTTVGGSRPRLYPAHCTVCEGGGRTLLHCAGTCARSFHPACIEELNRGTAVERDRKAQRQWKCGECTRGLHACQLCGFLGHEQHELVPCSLTDCGFYFHPACLAARGERLQLPLICPRHTCGSCHAIETDLAACWSCSKCLKSVHLRCRDGHPGPNTRASKTAEDILDPNFHVCTEHAVPGDTPIKAARHRGLQVHTRPGDIVLILDYGNDIVQPSTKEAAPKTRNQWGVVQRVEELNLRPPGWTQLLAVQLFSDGAEIDVLNRYVLPIGTANQFSSPAEMLKQLITSHARCEANVYHTLMKTIRADQRADDGATRHEARQATMQAFRKRAEILAIPPASIDSAIEGGQRLWSEDKDASDLVFGSGSSPLHMYLDTGRVQRVEIPNVVVTNGANEDANRDGDIAMHEADGFDDTNSREKTSGQETPTKSPGGEGRDQGHSSHSHGHTTHDDHIVEEEIAGMLNDLVNDVVEGLEHSTDGTGLLKNDKGLLDTAKTIKGKAVALHMPSATAATHCSLELPRKRLDDDNEPPLKKPRQDSTQVGSQLDYVPPPVTEVKFSHLPVHLHRSSSSIFGRSVMAHPKQVKPRRNASAAMLPDAVVEDLEQQVSDYFDDDVPFRRRPNSKMPVAAIPYLRPAFYRPSPFLYRGGSRLGRRVDSLSRVLLCQDKRNLKCFIQTVSEVSPEMIQCADGPSVSSGCVAVDLLSISSFPALRDVVRQRVEAAFSGQHSQFLANVRLYYCAYDGTRHSLSPSSKSTCQHTDWLCFCANVCHLTAVVGVPVTAT